MAHSHKQQTPGSWLMLVPVVLGLFFVATFIGYLANNDPQAAVRSPLTASLTVQTSRAEPRDRQETIVPPREGTSSGAEIDPVASYKQALALLDANYYGPPLDTKRTRQLTYEAIRGC